jgi:putative flippase GtrA
VRKIDRAIPSTVTRYLTVGLLNTCVGLGIIYLGLYLFRLGNVTANIMGYAVGIVFSFVLNKHWTFASKGQSAPQFLRFLLVTGTAYAANLATVMVLINAFGINNYLAQALGIWPYTTIGYFGSRLFVFRDNSI